MKKFLKICGVVCGVILLAFTAFCVWLETSELTDAYETLD
jgi:hypothetical protein